MRYPGIGVAALALLAGCADVAVDQAEVARLAEPAASDAMEASIPAPEDAPAGTCWAMGTDGPFETPCPYEMTTGFIETLQRALAARGGYSGEVTGRLDPETREAIRLWQAAGGQDTGVLAMTTALEFGLVPQPPGGVYEPGAKQAKAPVEVLKAPPPRVVPQAGAAGIY